MFWNRRKKHPRIEVSAKADLSCTRISHDGEKGRVDGDRVWLLFTSLENSHELELVLSEFTARDLMEVLSVCNLEERNK